MPERAETPSPEHQSISIHQLKVDTDHIISSLDVNDNGKHRAFTTKTMAQALEDASKKPMPRMLFSELWFEGEICFLFADTNVGKSALAIQIADAITKAKPIHGFKLELNQPEKVLFFDYELSEKQVELRYSNKGNEHYPFSDLLLRAEPNDMAVLNDETESSSSTLVDIEGEIIRIGAKIVIIDNLTYLNETLEKADRVLGLMKRLKALKEAHGYTFLILGHTPKRDNSKPIEVRDLFGSSNLMNFADSAFAIGQSQQGEQLRYIKQVKQRNCEKLYCKGNVILCSLEKQNNCMRFNFEGYGTEKEHLYQRSKEEKEALAKEIAKSYEAEPRPYCRVGREFGMHQQQVSRIIDKAKQDDVIDKNVTHLKK